MKTYANHPEDLEPWHWIPEILNEYSKDELIKLLRTIRGGAWYHYRAMSKEGLIHLIHEEYHTEHPSCRP